jgi:hypothetical protein
MTRRIGAVPTGGEEASVMASARTFKAAPRTALAGDGGLLTAGAVGILLGLNAIGVPMPAFVGVAALLLAPLLAWYLHGRRVDGMATLGAVLGFIAGIVAVFAALGVGALFGMSNTHIPAAVWVGLGIVGAVFLVAIVWLDVDALRDLSSRRREHVWLDILRLLATVSYFAFVAGWTVWAAGSLTPEVDRVPLLVVPIGPCVLGAAAGGIAELVVRRHEQRSRGHLASGA